MTEHNLSRRAVLTIAGGAAAVTGLTSPAAALSSANSGASSEIEAIRKRIGQGFTVYGKDSAANVVLEDLVELAPKVRLPMSFGNRVPFAVVFRHSGGADFQDGTYTFSDDGVTGTQLMVSRFVGEDGVARLEAVFN